MSEIQKLAETIAKEAAHRINNGVQWRVKKGIINRDQNPYAEQAVLEELVKILEKSI